MLAIVGRYGRLGNQLWTYANALAFAWENRFSITNPAFEANQYFKRSIVVANSENAQLPLNPIESSCVHRSARLVNKLNLKARIFPFINLGESDLIDFDCDPDAPLVLSQARLIFFSGLYFYAAKSLVKWEKHIRYFFSPIDTIERKVAAFIDRARAQCDLLIGVHMRHGDYRTFCEGIMFYSTEEYKEAMTFLADQFPGKRVGFVVCSDEAQDISQFGSLIVFHQLNPAIVDMYALSKCDYIFGPNSSFSHWASFYGNVPLHILDWKVQRGNRKNHGYESVLRDSFAPFKPDTFGKYSRRHVGLQAALKPKIRGQT